MYAFPQASAFRATAAAMATVIITAGVTTTAGTTCGTRYGTSRGSIAIRTTRWATSDPGGAGIARRGGSSGFSAGRRTGSCTITGTDSRRSGTVDGAGIPTTTAGAGTGTGTVTGRRFATCMIRTTGADMRRRADTCRAGVRRRAATPAGTESCGALLSSVPATRRIRGRSFPGAAPRPRRHARELVRIAEPTCPGPEGPRPGPQSPRRRAPRVRS